MRIERKQRNWETCLKRLMPTEKRRETDRHQGEAWQCAWSFRKKVSAKAKLYQPAFPQRRGCGRRFSRASSVVSSGRHRERAAHWFNHFRCIVAFDSQFHMHTTKCCIAVGDLAPRSRPTPNSNTRLQKLQNVASSSSYYNWFIILPRVLLVRTVRRFCFDSEHNNRKS